MIPVQFYHHEAEQSVLGGLMLDNKTWDVIADRLTHDDFYEPKHRIIFEAIAILSSKYQPFDWLMVSDQLKKMQELELVGGEDYLLELVNETPTAANIGAYADVVKKFTLDRKLLAVNQQIARLLESQDENRLDEAERLILSVNEIKSDPVNHIRYNLPKLLESIQNRRENKNKLLGISTGFLDLDNICKGLRPSNLIIIAGRPSMGKTQLALNITEQVGIKENLSVLIFSMEMTHEELAERLAVSISGLDSRKFQEGDFTEKEVSLVSDAFSKINQSGIHLDESSSLTIMELRARCRRLKRESGLDLVIVDYLSLMKGEGENQNKKIGSISRGLKGLAKELKIPVIALQQLNRSVEGRQDKRPVMSDLRESGEIEQDADLIAFIYRHEVYDETTPHKNIAEIIIRKNRSGAIGKVFLTFHGSKCRFDNYFGADIDYEKTKEFSNKGFRDNFSHMNKYDD